MMSRDKCQISPLTLVFVGTIIKLVRVIDKEVNNVKLVMSDEIREFIRNLQKRTKAKTFELLDLLSSYENHLGMPYSKKIDKKRSNDMVYN